MTRRRWIASEFDDGFATLKGEQANHLIRVLRAETGMRADVVAGKSVFAAVIENVGETVVRFRLEREIERDEPLPLRLWLAVFKFDRMEWAVEKATELGVSAIVPVISRRTEKHLAQAATTRVERWRRIALEAAKQSRGSGVPEIATPITLSAALKQSTTQDGRRILLWEQESEHTLARCVTDAEGPMAEGGVTLAVGPEGGWTEDEVALFSSCGWISATLGARILRAETAVIAGIAIISARLQETGQQERDEFSNESSASK